MMHPEESSLPSEESKRIAFTAFHTFKFASATLAEKLGDKYTAFEELFALCALLTETAQWAGMPLDRLLVNVQAMYQTERDAHGAANDTTH
jgi:hypothetical protein